MSVYYLVITCGAFSSFISSETTGFNVGSGREINCYRASGEEFSQNDPTASNSDICRVGICTDGEIEFSFICEQSDEDPLVGLWSGYETCTFIHLWFVLAGGWATYGINDEAHASEVLAGMESVVRVLVDYRQGVNVYRLFVGRSWSTCAWLCAKLLVSKHRLLREAVVPAHS